MFYNFDSCNCIDGCKECRMNGPKKNIWIPCCQGNFSVTTFRHVKASFVGPFLHIIEERSFWSRKLRPTERSFWNEGNTYLLCHVVRIIVKEAFFYCWYIRVYNRWDWPLESSCLYNSNAWSYTCFNPSTIDSYQLHTIPRTNALHQWAIGTINLV